MKPFSVKDITIFSKALLFFGLLIVQSMPLYMKISFPIEFWFKQIFMYFIWILVFYLTYLIIIPKLLFQGKNAFFFVVICIIIGSVLYISHTFSSIIDLAPKGEARKHVHHEEDKNQDESRRPGLIVPVIIGSGGIAVDH